MQQILAYKAPLEDYLDMYLKTQQGSIYDPVRYILDLGGKRLRPCLTLALTEALGAEVSSALPLAAAIEVFHNFTLLHDDIMDEAEQRRGEEAVHVKWNRDQAILSGDIMFAMSYELLAQSGSSRLPEMHALFTKTAKEVCIGQQLDMEFEARNNVSEDQYLEMIRYKTSVLIGAAAGLAGLHADVNPVSYQALYDYGIFMGMSFQIQDDILDAFGEQAAVGKRIGGDILQNKKTLLYLRARSLSSDKQRESLDHWMMSTQESQEKIDAVKTIMRDCGAVDAVRQVQWSYQDGALLALQDCGIQEPWLERLQDLVGEQSKRAH